MREVLPVAKPLCDFSTGPAGNPKQKADDWMDTK
jgi:hypothetical protein